MDRRAMQSGPSGKVRIKLAKTSLREGTEHLFDWDGSDDQIAAVIETELAIFRHANTSRGDR